MSQTEKHPVHVHANPNVDHCTAKNGTTKTALIIGASGLVGKQLLTLLLSSPVYTKVVVLARSPLAIRHEKLIEWIIDFDNIEQQLLQWPAIQQKHSLDSNHKIDDIYCTLGTTIKKAGSKQAFYRVDHHYPLVLAKHFHRLGATVFAIVTAVAANKNSLIFYNKVKGLIEADLQTIGYQQLIIVRPSMLSGDRQEFRLGEQISSRLMSIFAVIIPKRYQIIAAAKVAEAMLSYAQSGKVGISVVESEKIHRF